MLYFFFSPHKNNSRALPGSFFSDSVSLLLKMSLDLLIDLDDGILCLSGKLVICVSLTIWPLAGGADTCLR